MTEGMSHRLVRAFYIVTAIWKERAVIGTDVGGYISAIHPDPFNTHTFFYVVTVPMQGREDLNISGTVQVPEAITLYSYLN